MPDQRITDLGTLTGVDAADWVPIVDVSDTGQSALGSTKKTSVQELALRANVLAQGYATIGVSANYTVALADAGRVLFIDNGANARSIFVDAGLDLSIGQRVDFVQLGTGVITFATSGSPTPTLNATPGLKLRTQWSSCSLLCRATDSYVLLGDLTA